MLLHQVLLAAGLTKPEMLQIMAYIAGTEDDFFDTPMYDKLYEYFAFTTCEMPYGTAKARDGDPDTWILEHLAAFPTEQEMQWMEV